MDTMLWKNIAFYLHNLSGNKQEEQQQDIPFRNTVIAEPIKASSEDHPSQSLKETRAPLRFNRTFWSSTGSESADANEYAIYSLVNPRYAMERDAILSKRELKQVGDGIGLLLVDKVLIKAFMATWQNHNVYSSQFIRVSIGTSTEQFDLWTSGVIPVVHAPEEQIFDIGPIVILSMSESEMAENEENVTTSGQGGGNDIVGDDLINGNAITAEELADALELFKGQMTRHFIAYLQSRVKNRRRREEAQRMIEKQLEKITVSKECGLFIKYVHCCYS